MAYGKDLRCRVLDFVAQGGSKAEAARRFKISRSRVFAWLKQPVDYRPEKPGPKRSRKFDEEALRIEVEANPDALLRELAASRGVCINSIFLALRRMGFVRKKNSTLQRKPPKSQKNTAFSQAPICSGAGQLSPRLCR